MFRIAVVILLALACTACASTASRNDARWQTYAQLTAASAEAQRQADAEQSAQFDKIASSCPVGDSACVVAVAGFKALTMRGGGAGPAAGAAIPAPPLERDVAAKARDLLTGVAPLASTLAGAAVSWRQSDNSRDVSLAQYGFLGGVVESTSDAAIAIAQAGPRIEVGGNYGDTYGDGYTGGDRTDVGRDQIGGDRISDSVVGDDNRLDSPDDSFNGGDCTSAAGGAGGTTGAGNGGTAPGGPSTGCQAGDGGG